jgi:hypothetical protein
MSQVQQPVVADDSDNIADSDRGSINDRQDALNQTGRSGSQEPAGSSRGIAKARPKANPKKGEDKKKKMKQDPAAVSSVQNV